MVVVVVVREVVREMGEDREDGGGVRGEGTSQRSTRELDVESASEGGDGRTVVVVVVLLLLLFLLLSLALAAVVPLDERRSWRCSTSKENAEVLDVDVVLVGVDLLLSLPVPLPPPFPPPLLRLLLLDSFLNLRAISRASG